MEYYKEQITYYLNKINNEINECPARLSEHHIKQSLEALTHYVEKHCSVIFPIKTKNETD